jgi:hypothetical protein
MRTKRYVCYRRILAITKEVLKIIFLGILILKAIQVLKIPKEASNVYLDQGLVTEDTAQKT